MADTLTPPGRARITPCGECRGRGHYDSGTQCAGCRGAGRTLWRACPRCGDIGFDFINGRTEQDGMICRLGCGHRWTADDLGWLAQRLP